MMRHAAIPAITESGSTKSLGSLIIPLQMTDLRTRTHFSWEELEQDLSGSLELDEDTRTAIIAKLRSSHIKHKVRTPLLLCVHFARNDYQMIASRKEYLRAFSEYKQEEHEKLTIEDLSLAIFDDGETAYQLFHRYILFLRTLGYVYYITKRKVTAVRGPPKKFWARMGYSLTKQEPIHLVEYNLLVDFALTQEARTALFAEEKLKTVLKDRTPQTLRKKKKKTPLPSNASSSEGSSTDIIITDGTFTL